MRCQQRRKKADNLRQSAINSLKPFQNRVEKMMDLDTTAKAIRKTVDIKKEAAKGILSNLSLFFARGHVSILNHGSKIFTFVARESEYHNGQMVVRLKSDEYETKQESRINPINTCK